MNDSSIQSARECAVPGVDEADSPAPLLRRRRTPRAAVALPVRTAVSRRHRCNCNAQFTNCWAANYNEKLYTRSEDKILCPSTLYYTTLYTTDYIALPVPGPLLQGGGCDTAAEAVPLSLSGAAVRPGRGGETARQQQHLRISGENQPNKLIINQLQEPKRNKTYPWHQTCYRCRSHICTW